jgi:hypothetical protein
MIVGRAAFVQRFIRGNHSRGPAGVNSDPTRPLAPRVAYDPERADARRNAGVGKAPGEGEAAPEELNGARYARPSLVQRTSVPLETGGF